MSGNIASISRCMQKEFRLEWRGGEVLFPCILLGLVSSCIAGLTLTSLRLPQEALNEFFFPLAWILFFLTGSVGSGKLFEHEWNSKTFPQLELFSVPWWHTYIGKTLFSATTSLVLLVTVLTVLASLLRVPLEFSILHLGVILASVSIAFGAITALLSAVTVFSPLRAILLPILILPLVVPLLFAAVELSLDLQAQGTLDFASPWFSLVLGLGLFFVLAGVNLTELIVRE